MEENRNNDFKWDDVPAAAEVPAEPEIAVEPEIPVEHEAPAEVPQRRKPATKPDSKPGVPKKLPLPAIAAAVVALIVIIVLITSLGSPKRIAKKYIDAYLYNDIVAMHKYLAYDSYASTLGDEDEEDYFEDMSDLYDEDITSWKDLAAYYHAQREEDLLDEFGEYKIEITVSRVKDLSDRALEREFEWFMDDLEDNTDFDRDDISSSKTVNLKLKIKGDEGTERGSCTVYLVKMGLSWKVLYVTLD